jgi:DNA-binding NarL/FixJ family response regulator
VAPIPIRILLIEDDPADAFLLQELLAEEAPGEFVVTHAERLADGLRSLAGSDCEIVLSDLGLPDSQGAATFEQIHRQAPRLPVILLSGLDDEALGTRLILAGAQDYIVKGRAPPGRLARAIRAALERAKAAAPRAQGGSPGSGSAV